MTRLAHQIIQTAFKNLRQQPHPINLPQPQSQRKTIAPHKRRLHQHHLPLIPLRLQPPKRRLNIQHRLHGPLEQHEHHHNAEDLQRVARHVHADGVHWELFGGRYGELPGLFEFEGVHFVGRGWFARCDGIFAGFGTGL